MSATPAAASLDIRDLVVHFGDTAAVQQASISIEAGEFFTLLGPSGCGKTTILRTIAGFNRQTSGSILVGGRSIDSLPAHRRDTGMVFQNYAVFPHLTVAQNVSYGLKSRGIGKAEASRRVAEALDMVDLSGYADRLPSQLSGGQQQRVVIARAIVVRPRVLLMDEPLANLDAKLRVRLRHDLRALQRELGITTVYVTHDQEEALSLSDRIAVMSTGRVLQIGVPEEIYRKPRTLAVAAFIGEANFLLGRIDRAGRAQLGAAGELAIPESELRGQAWIGFRPEDASMLAPETAGSGISGTIVQETYLGSVVRYEMDCGLERTIAVQTAAPPLGASTKVGERAGVRIDASMIMVFPGADLEREL